MNIHTAPLTVMIADAGCEENSFNTSRHVSAVQKRMKFHIVRVNTSHNRRVTRKGCLLMTDIRAENLKARKCPLKQNQATGPHWMRCLRCGSMPLSRTIFFANAAPNIWVHPKDITSPCRHKHCISQDTARTDRNRADWQAFANWRR